MYNNYHKIIEDFVWYYNQGYITDRDGNACIKLDRDLYLVTASGIKKQNMTLASFVHVNSECEVVSKTDKTPSIETAAHISALKATGKTASVHVHSPLTVALFAKANKRPNDTFNLSNIENELRTQWPELFRYTKLGTTVSFLDPGSDELHKAIEVSFSRTKSDIIVLMNHGVIAVGNTLEECREHILRTEHICKILLRIYE